MSSTFFRDGNDIYNNNKEFLKIVKVKLQRKKSSKQIENNENLNNKLFNLNFLKETNIKRTRMKRQYFDNEFIKKTMSLNNQEKYISEEKAIFPLLNSEHHKTSVPNTNSNSLINLKTIKKEKDFNINYLYLEYKKDNKTLDDVTYIKIEPNKIITFLIDFPNIKQIFHVLTEKINKRNIKNPNIVISDLKINIEEILYGKEKSKKNNIIDIKHNSINNMNNINRLNTSTTVFLSEEEKNKEKNYPIYDLFFFDIINKVINQSIFLHDKRSQKIDEEFMIKEYKNQISKLKLFFYEKFNDKKITNNFINLFQIRKFDNKKNLSLNKDLNTTHKKNSNRNKSKDNNNNEIFEKPISNIYNIDIGPKIKIIDSNELLNKIRRQKNNNNFFNKLLELNNKKIKFHNIMIEEKTKLLNYNDIFKNENSKYNSINILNKNIIRKNLFIRSKIFHEYEDEIENDIKNIIGKSMSSLRKITVYDTKTNKSLSSINEKENIKIKSKEKEKEGKNNDMVDMLDNINTKKIIIEKLSTKNDFGVTKIIFNKTIDKINKINKINLLNNKSRMRKYNFSFLNSIYGKINTKRKMKINELDFKNEINNKGYQLLFNALKNPFLKINKSKSEENILLNKNKKTIDKAINTKEIIFNY